MTLPRKHIAEGIAVAIVAGVADVQRVLAIDPSAHWKHGEPHAFVAYRDLRDPTEEDLREALSFCEDSLTHGEPIRIRERAQSNASSGGLTVTSKHGRCYEVIS